MPITCYTNARAHLKQVMDDVIQSNQATLITRYKGGNVVMLSQDQYESIAKQLGLEVPAPWSWGRSLKEFEQRIRSKAK